MDNEIILDLSSYTLGKALGLQVIGPDLPIRSIMPLSKIAKGSLCFSKHMIGAPFEIGATVITSETNHIGSVSIIVSAHPRLDFARALIWIDSNDGIIHPVKPPVIHPSAKIGQYVVIGNGSTIGANTIVQHNVVIGENVSIGERCVIKSSAVIGEDGFGFERDENGIPVRLVHLGRVLIGNDVEIGSLTTVCRGTLDNTVIEDHVKIDDHVHIAHNVHIKRAAMIIACAEVSGGVKIGEEAWIGPNSSIIQQLTIGRQALVGIGANVIREVEPGVTVAGNPAKAIIKH